MPLAGTLMQTGVSLGRQLVFFLFLLIPGYLFVKAYYWSNIAKEENSRVGKLVLMAMAGVASLVFVSIWRQFVPEPQFCVFVRWLETFVARSEVSIRSIVASLVLASSWWKFIPVFPVCGLETLVPEAFVIKRKLSVKSISGLTVLQSANLIVSQATVGILIGFTLGTLEYVVYDQRQPEHKDMDEPWEILVDETKRQGAVEIVTTSGDRIEGRLKSIGSPSEKYDVLVSDPVRVCDDEEDDPLGEMSYHHHDDICQVITDESLSEAQRPWLQRKHMALLQRLVSGYQELKELFGFNRSSGDRTDDEEYELEETSGDRDGPNEEATG